MTRPVWWLSLAFLLWSAATNLVMPFLPLLARAYGATPFQVGLVQGAVYAGAALALVPANWLAARGHGKPAIMAMWAAGGLGALLLALAGGWRGLLPGAFLLLAGGGALPVVAAMVAGLIPDRGVRRAMSLVFAAAPAGLLAGSGAGGLIADRWGLRALCLTSATLSAVALVALIPVAAGRGRPAVMEGGAPSGGGAGAVWQLLLAGLPAGAVYLLLCLPSGFMTIFLRDVAGFSLSGTGFTNGQLAVGELAWSALFAVWPGESGAVEVRAGTWLHLRFSRGTLLAMAVCLAANAGFGLLFPLGSTVAVLAAILLRGALFSLQPLGLTLVSETGGPEGGLAGSFTALALLMGGVTAVAPAMGGLLYAVNPAWPFRVAGLAAAVGGAVLLGVRQFGRRP